MLLYETCLNKIESLKSLKIIPKTLFSDEDLYYISLVFKNIPYFVGDGYLFLGASSWDDVHSDSFLLQSHFDHPGGMVMEVPCDQLLSVRFAGHSGKLPALGKRMGFFKQGEEHPLAVLPVLDSVVDHFGPILYFDLSSFGKDPCVLLHTIVCPVESDSSLDSSMKELWNADNILNVALICSLLEKHFKIYGLLTLGEEIGCSTLYKAMANIKKRALKCIHLDVTEGGSFLEKEVASFGLRKYQTSLSDFMKLNFHLKDYTMKNHSGESSLFEEYGIDFMSLFFKIKFMHNGVSAGFYGLEQFCESDFKEYVLFVENFLVNSKYLQNKEVLLLEDKNKDNTEEKRNVLLEKYEEIGFWLRSRGEGYQEFCLKSLPQINSFRKMLGIEPLRISCQEYQKIEPLKEVNLQVLDNVIFDLYEELKGFLLEKGIFFIEPQKLKIAFLRRVPFNASLLRGEMVAINLDLVDINSQEFKRVIVHECTHLLLSKVLPLVSGNSFEHRMMNEGFAIWVSYHLLKIPLENALGYLNVDMISKYKEEVDFYWNDWKLGKIYEKYCGKYHSFLKIKSIQDPFESSNHELSRYGYQKSYEAVDYFMQERLK